LSPEDDLTIDDFCLETLCSTYSRTEVEAFLACDQWKQLKGPLTGMVTGALNCKFLQKEILEMPELGLHEDLHLKTVGSSAEILLNVYNSFGHPTDTFCDGGR